MKENPITRINYDKTAIGLLELSFFVPAWVITYLFEHNPSIKIPPPFFGHIHDVTFPFIYASVSRAMPIWNRSSNQNAAYGFAASSFIEVGQLVGIVPGTFDAIDFVSHAIGTLAWRSYDAAAKLLYNSKLTMPIYKLLRIQDRRNRT